MTLIRVLKYSILKYIHGNNPRSIRDIMAKSKSRSIYTMVKTERNILEKVEKYPKKVNSVGTVVVTTVVLGWNSGVWAVFIG
jgi:hypothetical protein